MNPCSQWPRCRLNWILVGVLGNATLAHAQVTGFYSTNAFPSLTFSNPVCFAVPAGETNRLFVLEKHGRVIVITNLASPTRTIFMDISAEVIVSNPSESADVSGEEGLLGMAFHPGYATNRTFFLYYTGTATNGGSGLHDILARFQTMASNPNQGDNASEVRLIAQFDHASNHNAGDIHFGPEGYLYLPLGDEGGADDTYNNSQVITNNFFSAVLRLDVDQRPGSLSPNANPAIVSPTNYAVPPDNPFIGSMTFNGQPVDPTRIRTEFWVVGMRNPWRISYDGASATWYCGDVGQSAREEIDILQSGNNYGWACREGLIAGPKTPPLGFTSVDPILDYGHTNAGFGTRTAVVGGLVYRGLRAPSLVGAYVYGDFGSGEIWALRYNGTTVTTNQFLVDEPGLSTFGVDPRNGDVLYASLMSGNNSLIKRILPVSPVPVFTSIDVSAGNAVIRGGGGSDGGSYFVLTTTNLAPPSGNWTSIATNNFDAIGNFGFTVPLPTTATKQFYRLQMP